MGIVDLLIVRGEAAGGLRGGADVRINASAHDVYGLITDVTRTGEWSRECYRCVWLGGGSGPDLGAQFKGYNRHGLLRWSTTCTVTEYEPDRVFAFDARPAGGKTQSRWRYELEPAGNGTAVRESFRVLWYARPIMLLFGGNAARLTQMENGVRDTLYRMKDIAEREQPAIPSGEV